MPKDAIAGKELNMSPLFLWYNLVMEGVTEVCRHYDIALCYLFGSRAETAISLLRGKRPEIVDRESDIDFAVLFEKLPENSLKTYGAMSLDLQEVVAPFRADLLFLHEADHLLQLEAVKGICIYSISDEFRENYEERVMMYASDEWEIFKLNEKDLFEAIEDGYFEFEYKAHRG